MLKGRPHFSDLFNAKKRARKNLDLSLLCVHMNVPYVYMDLEMCSQTMVLKESAISVLQKGNTYLKLKYHLIILSEARLTSSSLLLFSRHFGRFER